MFRWLNGPGEVFRKPLPGSTNYLNAYDRSGNLMRAQKASADKGRNKQQETDDKEQDMEGDEEDASSSEKSDVRRSGTGDQPPVITKETVEDLMPFPMNRAFRSQSVLSEELKDVIWKRVMDDGKSVRDVSAALGVEMRRVAAVVRLKGVENEWNKQGKSLATPYSKAIQSMLPQTPYIPHDPITHESINDLPVHRATEIQIFHPVSESRHFTRRDAGKVFDSKLLPAEDRIPHAELVPIQQWINDGVVSGERQKRQREANQAEADKKKEIERIKRAREAQEVTKAETERSVFRFQDIQVESVGKDGRDRKGVGARYGIPHQDRKKGQIKIPTRVD